MKAIRWTRHALQNLIEREINQFTAQQAIIDPEFIIPDPPKRVIYMRRYFDEQLHQDMLLRMVIEADEFELVVVTLYKTSQIHRYLKEFLP